MATADNGQPLFLQAINGSTSGRVPIWLMRQAGRYMAEYRAVRERVPFLELCRSPELCAEVMKTAVEKLGVDAAIIFSDLLPMLQPMGFHLEYRQGDGPVIDNPFRSRADLDRIRVPEDLSELDFVFQTVRKTREALSPGIPVIGFAGGPFTLAAYATEGGGSGSFYRTKRLMYSDPELWQELMTRMTQTIRSYLLGQIQAGAETVQIFDSWAGILGPDEYSRFVLPWTQSLIATLSGHVPTIYFWTGNPDLLPLALQTKSSVLGLDWRVAPERACREVPATIALQGNLDPVVLLANRDTIRRETLRVLDAFAGHSRFIFNLGHGVLKETPVENVQFLVELVHQWRPRPQRNDATTDTKRP